LWRNRADYDDAQAVTQSQATASVRLAEGIMQIIITRDGKPVACLTELPKGVPIPGRGKGTILFHAEDDSHMEDFKEYM
jgi:hypothetical protein